MGPVIRRLLETHGLDAVELAREAGVDLAQLPSPTERIEADKVDALVSLAIPRIADSAFGLQAARCWHPSNLGVLGHAWLSSSTLRTGVQRLVRYFRILGERGRLETADVPNGMKLRFWAGRGNPAADPVAAVVVDMVMAMLLDMCRLNAGAAVRPLTVNLRRRPPDDPQAYERFFGCPVDFGATENALVLAASDADRLLPTSNRQLAATFDRMLTDEIARLDRSDVVSGCKAAILEHLSTGEMSEDEAAAQLHISPRTLQRKLAEARTTYGQLVDGLRKDLALRYVDDPHRSFTDITYSLGFAGPSSLTRAFKRWTGLSPTDYRSRSSAARWD
jgi:AraC-like DNA-binding protein